MGYIFFKRAEKSKVSSSIFFLVGLIPKKGVFKYMRQEEASLKKATFSFGHIYYNLARSLTNHKESIVASPKITKDSILLA